MDSLDTHSECVRVWVCARCKQNWNVWAKKPTSSERRILQLYLLAIDGCGSRAHIYYHIQRRDTLLTRSQRTIDSHSRESSRYRIVKSMLSFSVELPELFITIIVVHVAVEHWLYVTTICMHPRCNHPNHPIENLSFLFKLKLIHTILSHINLENMNSFRLMHKYPSGHGSFEIIIFFFFLSIFLLLTFRCECVSAQLQLPSIQ